MALDKRVIAIQVSPKAYDAILALKGEQTWTRFEIECVLAKVGDNAILKDELAGLIAEAKARKDKKAAEVETEVPSAEEAERVELEGGKTLIMPHTHKSKKAKDKKAAETKVTGEEPSETELKAIEVEQPV